MLRPLAVDLLGFLLPLALAAGAFIAGRCLGHLPRLLQHLLLALVIGLVALLGAALAGLLPARVAWTFSRFGNLTVPLCWAALFLLGVVWSVRARRVSSGFLACLCALAAGVLVIETGGRLWWRLGAPGLWDRTADAQGCLAQSTGITCSPAAAVMLLHHYGITAGEGEMAYLADTSLLGTHGQAMAQALTCKVQTRGWHAEVQQVDYATCVHAATPFLAHIQDPIVGPHTLLVARATAERVEVVDPLDGSRKSMSRTAFEQVWDGTIIRVIRPAGTSGVQRADRAVRG